MEILDLLLLVGALAAVAFAGFVAWDVRTAMERKADLNCRLAVIPVRHTGRGCRALQGAVWGGCGGFMAGLALAGMFVLGVWTGQSRGNDDPLPEAAPIESAVSEDASPEGASSQEASASTAVPEAKELSVPPIGLAVTQYPADRPEWINKPPKVEGQAHMVVSSGPWASRRECERELEHQLKKEVDAYINDYLGNPQAARLIGYDLETIQKQFVSSDPAHVYSGTLVSPTVGEMREEVRLVVIDEQDQRDIAEHWRRVVATSRLASSGLIGAGLLGLLAVAYGFLKADTATRGFYTGRLQLLSLAVVAAMIAAGVFLARAIHWM